MSALTLTITEAAELLGLSASHAYQLARSGGFPSPVIKAGGRIVVPTKPLLDLLGLDELPKTTTVEAC